MGFNELKVNNIVFFDKVNSSNEKIKLNFDFLKNFIKKRNQKRFKNVSLVEKNHLYFFKEFEKVVYV